MTEERIDFVIFNPETKQFLENANSSNKFPMCYRINNAKKFPNYNSAEVIRNCIRELKSCIILPLKIKYEIENFDEIL